MFSDKKVLEVTQELMFWPFRILGSNNGASEEAF